ncbi:MAG: hypothetical protein AB7P52_05205 [Alphaproteobacteria bacterium]
MSFLKPKVEQPLKGGFRVYTRTDWRGRTWQVAKFSSLHPFAARCADTLGKASSAGLCIGGLYLLAVSHVKERLVWVAAFLPLCLVGICQKLFRRLFRARRAVWFNDDFVRIRGKRYNRHQLRGFAAREDDPKAHDEQRLAAHRQQQARRRPNPSPPPPLYYGPETRTIVGVFDVGMVKVRKVYGLANVNDILVLLNGINDAHNARLGAGIGRPVDPAADNPPGRGGIPD